MSTPSKNIFWLSASRVVSLVLLFIAYTQLFRYLGTYQFGQFQFVLSYVTLFGVVIDFGIQQYVIKKISEDRSQAKTYFHHFFAVEVFLSIFIYLSMVLVAYFANYDTLVIKAIALAGFGAAINGLTYPFLAVITAFYDLKKAALLNLISSVINVAMIFVTIYTGHGILLLVSQQFMYACVALILYYQFVQKFIGHPQLFKGMRSIDLSWVKTMFISAFPFAVLVGFSTVYNRIDMVLIGKILGYAQTGIYSAAYKLFDLTSFFPAVVSHSLYPLFASLMIENKIVEVRAILEKYLRFMIAIALPMATGGMVLATPIIKLVAGQDFIAAAPVLQILIWAPAVLFIYIIFNALVISQLTKYAMVITGVNVLVNLLGNLILLPRVGIAGAAIMTVVSEFLQGLFYFYFVRTRITNFSFFKYTWQPFLASAVMGAVLLMINLPLMVEIVLGGLVYALALLILGFYKSEDIAFIKQMLGRNAQTTI